MLAKLIPWRGLDHDSCETRRLREETAAFSDEARSLAPMIAAQSDYLARKAELNGFSRQLRDGFERRSTGQ